MIVGTTSSQAEVFSKNVDLGSVRNTSENVCENGITTTSDHEEVVCENVDQGFTYSANLIDIENSDYEEDESNDYLKILILENN